MTPETLTKFLEELKTLISTQLDPNQTENDTLTNRVSRLTPDQTAQNMTRILMEKVFAQVDNLEISQLTADSIRTAFPKLTNIPSSPTLDIDSLTTGISSIVRFAHDNPKSEKIPDNPQIGTDITFFAANIGRHLSKL